MADSPISPEPVRNKDTRGDKLPGPGMAFVIILLASLPLLGAMYLGAQLLRLPFAPFDLYNWPGRAGFTAWSEFVDALNSGLATGGNLAQAAPIGQWLLGIVLFFLVVEAVGLAFYVFIIRRGRVPDLIDGIVVGAILAAPLIFAGLMVGSSPLPALMIILWITALCLVWGIVLSYAFGRLIRHAEPEPITAEDSASTQPPSGMDRRRFLLQFGAGAAAVTAVTAVAGTLLSRREDAVALQRTLPMIEPEFLAAQNELFGDFRRFAIVRGSATHIDQSTVLALGTEYPDHNYVSIWLGGRSPIVIYENLDTALAAYSTEEESAGLFWLDG